MNLPGKLSVGLILLLIGVALGGCSMSTPQDSSIPWAQPSNWQNVLPGMENNTH
jgi:hypothetical protein